MPTTWKPGDYAGTIVSTCLNHPRKNIRHLGTSTSYYWLIWFIRDVIYIVYIIYVVWLGYNGNIHALFLNPPIWVWVKIRFIRSGMIVNTQNWIVNSKCIYILYRFIRVPTGWSFQPLWIILVSWYHYSQYMESHKIPWFQTTNQHLYKYWISITINSTLSGWWF